MGGAGSSLVAENGPRLVDTPEFHPDWKPEALAMADILEWLRGADTALDWFYISPAALYGSYAPGETTGSYRTGGDVLVTRLAATREDHPLLIDVPLAGVHVSRARRLEVPPWADAVLESPETPLLIVGEEAGQRIAVLGFDVHQSDMPLQPAFPILMQHVLDWLVPPDSVATPVVRVGDAAAIVPLPETRTVDVATPDGRRVRIAPPLPVAPFSDTLQPGVYEVHQVDASGSQTMSLFAANFVSPPESQLAASQAPPAVLSPGPGGTTQPGVPAAPRELWQWTALLAIVVLAAEWLAYHRQ